MRTEEVFSTKSASISQCDVSNSFVLAFGKEEIAFRMCDLYAFKKKIMEIDIVELLDSSTPRRGDHIYSSL